MRVILRSEATKNLIAERSFAALRMTRACHSEERSDEESYGRKILRCAQDDKGLRMT